MGKPTGGNAPVSTPECIGCGGETGGSDTSQYPEERKSNRDSPSSGERTGISLNWMGVKPAGVAHPGLWDHTGEGGGLPRRLQRSRLAEQTWKGRP